MVMGPMTSSDPKRPSSCPTWMQIYRKKTVRDRGSVPSNGPPIGNAIIMENGSHVIESQDGGLAEVCTL